MPSNPKGTMSSGNTERYREILGMGAESISDESMEMLVALLVDIADVAIGLEMDRVTDLSLKGERSG